MESLSSRIGLSKVNALTVFIKSKKQKPNKLFLDILMINNKPKIKTSNYKMALKINKRFKLLKLKDR